MALLDLLRQSALRNPAGIALVHGERRLSYGDLWEAVGGGAKRLIDAGLAPGARVGLLLDNCPEYVIYYYATLAAGGVVVPLNTASRARDLIYQLQHCAATHWVTDGTHGEAAQVARALPSAQVLDAHATLSRGASPSLAVDPLQPASIIYTSGTTGRPKGVTLSHGNLDANVRSILNYLGLRAGDVIVNVLPFYYSYGNSVLHTHLAAGATLVLDCSLIYPQAVIEAMARERATGFSGVPSSYAVLFGRTRVEHHDLSSVRYLTQAGGAMSPQAVDRIRELLPQARFFVMYGQTEATARLTYLPPERLDVKRGSVGIPIPGVELTLRNEHGETVPQGEVGEIWARGGNVMLGYWEDREGTQRVLQEGWLKTGDLARQDSDGYIFIEGRTSEMIKCGAHRISPVEVEEVLAELAEVEEAAVTGIPDEVLGQAIKAVIVRRQGAELDRLTVQHHCRQRLPAYKVPKLVEFAQTLPRTASGKVQRYLLAVPGETKGEKDVHARTGSDGAGSTGLNVVAD